MYYTNRTRKISQERYTTAPDPDCTQEGSQIFWYSLSFVNQFHVIHFYIRHQVFTGTVIHSMALQGGAHVYVTLPPTNASSRQHGGKYTAFCVRRICHYTTHAQTKPKFALLHPTYVRLTYRASGQIETRLNMTKRTKKQYYNTGGSNTTLRGLRFT